MSAYVVGRNHIQFLVKAAPALAKLDRDKFRYFHKGTWHDIDQYDLTENIRVGNMLWQENIKSVSTRYPRGTQKTRTKPIGETFVFGDDDVHVAFAEYRPSQVLKSCHCYEEQSCEHEGWNISEAHSFIRALEYRAMRHVAGYEEAEWGAPDPMNSPTPK
jgi:hypothetical protein